jgi:phage terminase Nu1 subunit (DNA packaging protein)
MDFQNLSKIDLATALGVNIRSITRWVKDGLPRAATGKFCLPECVTWLVERARASGAGSDDEGKRWLTIFRKERALISELERKKLEGSLIPRDEAVKWAVSLATEAKMAFLALPRRTAPVLYGKEIRDIEALLRTEIRAILTRLAQRGINRNRKRSKDGTVTIL